MIFDAKISNQNRDNIIKYIKEKKGTTPVFKVIDIGGSLGGWSHEVVDFIVDINPPISDTHVTFFSFDICNESKWNEILDYVKKNGKFDFSICSHTLEDVIHPQVICNMLPKISKEGFISVPSKFRELSRWEGRGVPNNNVNYRGYIHHRWVMHIINDTLYAWSKISIIENNCFDSISDMNENKMDLNFRWKNDFNFELVNSGFLGPSGHHIMKYYYDGLKDNIIYKQNTFDVKYIGNDL